MTLPSVRVLWNPASGRGRGARCIGQIRAAFAAYDLTDFRASQAPGDEARLVHEAIADGIETMVVAGGDGTWSKCGVALARAGSPARMAFLSAGTGNDFAKNFRADPKDYRAMAALVAGSARGGRDGVERRVDVGRLDDDWFLNVVGFGFDATVLEASNAIRAIKGPPVYIYTALREIRRYPGLDAEIRGVATIPEGRARRLLIVISNGKDFGGAFKIAPPARVDDGLLDVVTCNDDAHWSARLPLLARAMRGTHLTHPRVLHGTTASCTLTLPAPMPYELDGELHHTPRTTVTVASVPGALRVLDTPA